MMQVKEPKEAIRELEAEVGFQLSGYIEGTSRVPDRLKIPLDKLKSYLNSALNLHDSGNEIYVESELKLADCFIHLFI